jgi:hypothetical protein
MATEQTRYVIFPDEVPGWSSPLFILGSLAALVYQPPTAAMSLPAAAAGFVLTLGLMATRAVNVDREDKRWLSGLSGVVVLVFFWSLIFVMGAALAVEWDAGFDGFLVGAILSLAAYHAVYLVIARDISGW